MDYIGVLGASTADNALKDCNDSIKKLKRLCTTYDSVFDDLNKKKEEFEYKVRNFQPK